MFLCAFRKEFTPESAKQFANTLFKKTNTPNSTNPKTQRETQRVHELRLCTYARNEFAKGNDEPLRHALQTKRGQHEFKEILTQTPAYGSTMMQNNRNLIKRTGKRHKKEIVSILSRGMSREAAANNLAVTKAYVDYARSKKQTKTSLGKSQRAPQSKKKRTAGNVQLLTDMFLNTTTVLSGANQFKRRNLEFQKHQWEIELHALYPSFLREYAYFNPEELEKFEKFSNTVSTQKYYLTKFQKDIIAAVRQAEQPEHDAMQELDDRRSAVNPHSLLFSYIFPLLTCASCSLLGKRALRCLPASKTRASEEMEAEEFGEREQEEGGGEEFRQPDRGR
jgi:hypothetical protein